MLTVDFSKTNAETHVYNYNSSNSSSFTGISSANVELGLIGGTAAKTQTFAFESGNTATAATLVVNGGAGNVAITDHSAVKTVTLKGTGTDSTLGTVTLGASVTKLVITGDKKVDIKATNLGTGIAEIDASGNTAGVLVQQEQAINQKFTGSSANDTLIIGAAGTNLANLDTLNGGNGTDTLQITTAIGSAAVAANVTNFEILSIDANGGDVSQDLAFFPVSTVKVADGTNNVTFTNALNNSVVNVDADIAAAKALTFNLKDNSATDAVTFNVGATAGGITVTSLNPDVRFETVTVNSQGTAANTVTAIGTAVGNVSFTGATGLTLTSLANVTGVLDFSKMTAAVTVGSAANTAIGSVANQTIIGTGLADTLKLQNTGGAIDGVTVNAGAGNDTVTVYSNTNASKFTNLVIDLGAGNDTLTYEANNADSTATVTIKDGAGLDYITLGAQHATSSVDVQIAATNSNDGVFVTGLASAAAGAGTDISYKGGLVNGTGTTSASASIAAVASTTSVSADMATVLAANSNSTGYVIGYNLSGDASTALTNAATWVDAATFGTRCDTLESALASAIGTVTGLDNALSTTDKVLMAFDNGTHSVLAYVTNTDTTVANTLTAAEIQVVGVFASTAALAAQDFIA